MRTQRWCSCALTSSFRCCCLRANSELASCKSVARCASSSTSSSALRSFSFTRSRYLLPARRIKPLSSLRGKQAVTCKLEQRARVCRGAYLSCVLFFLSLSRLHTRLCEVPPLDLEPEPLPASPCACSLSSCCGKSRSSSATCLTVSSTSLWGI